MYWVYLIFAIMLEVAGTTCMKLSQGFTRLLPSIFIFVFYGLCFTLFTLAVKRIDISVAYAVWSGLGTALIAVLGILYFKEPSSALKVISIGLIIIGIIGLNLSEGVR